MDGLNEQQQQFIELLTPIVQEMAKKYGYQDSVCQAIVAQICFESGYGTSELAQNANNYCGIKHGGKNVWQGLTYDIKTGEVVPTDNNISIDGGSRYWRAYDSLDDSVEGYFKYLDEHQDVYNYSRLRDDTNPEDYSRHVAAGGYTGNDKEAYSKTVNGIMNLDGFEEAYERGTNNFSHDKINEQEDKKEIEEVSVDYEFVKNYMSSLELNINKSSIINSQNVGIVTSGSTTFQAANTVFDNYANISINFLNSLSVTCENILTMSESLNELDKSLAASVLNSASLSLDSITLSNFNKFYDELPNTNMLSNFKDEGGTLKITKEGLFDAMSDSNIILSSLTNDIMDTKKIKEQLDSFVQDSTNNLKGPAWDKMRIKVNEYSETCQKKINYANNLIQSMKDAYQKLLDHMEEFDILDMSQIDEITQGISNMKDQILALESLIASTPDYEDIIGYDPKTGMYVVVGQLSHIAEKESWRETIKICEEVQAILERNLQKLNELPSVDSSAAEEIISNTTNQPEISTATPISKQTQIETFDSQLDTNNLDSNNSTQTINNEITNDDIQNENTTSSLTKTTDEQKETDKSNFQQNNQDNTSGIINNQNSTNNDNQQKITSTQASMNNANNSRSQGTSQNDNYSQIESVPNNNHSNIIEQVQQISEDNTPLTLYIVKEGDTLSEIARRYGISLEELLKYNNIENPDLIYIDQEINIPTN